MKLYFYKVSYKDTNYYASSELSADQRWVRLQNDFIYKKQIMPTLLRNIFEAALKDNTVPKFAVVQEKKEETSVKKNYERTPKVQTEELKQNRREYDIKTSEHQKAKKRKYYALNRIELLQQKKDYHNAHKEDILQYKRAYRIQNKDQISIQKKEYYQRKKLEKAIQNKIEIDSGSLVIENNK